MGSVASQVDPPETVLRHLPNRDLELTFATNIRHLQLQRQGRKRVLCVGYDPKPFFLKGHNNDKASAAQQAERKHLSVCPVYCVDVCYGPALR